VRPQAGTPVWILDRAAASLLREGSGLIQGIPSQPER
jgi:hypothetical protein